MRAKEFITEITRPTSLYDAERLLKRFGWFFHDEGSYGKVFVKEGLPYVLKVFKKEDAAFLSFVNFCKQFPNKHFPIFKGDIIKITGNICAIKTEKLALKKFNYIYDGLTWNTISDYLWGYVQTKIKPNQTKYKKDYNCALKFLEKYQELQQALDLMVEHLDYIKFLNDIHGKNIMLRKKTIVLVDPICI
jgi:hypothetical protein